MEMEKQFILQIATDLPAKCAIGQDTLSSIIIILTMFIKWTNLTNIKALQLPTMDNLIGPSILDITNTHRLTFELSNLSL